MDGKRRAEAKGGLKSHIENAGVDGMAREGWRGESGLNSQIENTGEERMKRVGGGGKEDSNRRFKTHWRNSHIDF